MNNLLINLKQSQILAQYTIAEAIHSRFFIILFSCIGFCLGLELFLDQVALFEKEATQLALIAGFLRLSAVYLIGLFVITAMTQAFNQQTIYLFMALPLARSTYILGKLLGFSILALAICGLFALLLLAYIDNLQLILWLISLYCELLLMISLAIFFSLSFHNTLPALTGLIGFYLLARSIYAIQLMSDSFQNSHEWLELALYYVSQFVALLLPDLSRFTRSEWLIYQTGHWEILLELVLQTIIYLLLIISASLFDFYRKNL
jgi:ABC-type transport system involved in multi-copper enzyme maturation permease subunit